MMKIWKQHHGKFTTCTVRTHQTMMPARNVVHHRRNCSFLSLYRTGVLMLSAALKTLGHLLCILNLTGWLTAHYQKSFQIRSDFWSVFSRIRTEYGEIWSICCWSEQCIGGTIASLDSLSGSTLLDSFSCLKGRWLLTKCIIWPSEISKLFDINV